MPAPSVNTPCEAHSLPRHCAPMRHRAVPRGLGGLVRRARRSLWAGVSLGTAVGFLAWTLATPAASQAAGYQVQTGDTLWTISARYHVSMSDIIRVNHLTDPNLIYTGEVLTIPLPAPPPVARPTTTVTYVHYRVQPGDNLTFIAKHFGLSPATLASINHISNPNIVWVGVVLTIPVVTTAPAASATPTWDDQGFTTRSAVGALLRWNANDRHVNPSLVKAVAWQESGWTQNVVAQDGGVGVMQLMPSTSAWIGPYLMGHPIDPYRINDNVAGGTSLLHYLLAQERGNQPLAVAAYNEGLTPVRRGVIYTSTKRYVRNVLALEKLFANGGQP